MFPSSIGSAPPSSTPTPSPRPGEAPFLKASLLQHLKTLKPQAKGQKPISFHEGGLHASTGTAAGAPIPVAKHAAAESGSLGPKAKKQEQFYRNVLK